MTYMAMYQGSTLVDEVDTQTRMQQELGKIGVLIDWKYIEESLTPNEVTAKWETIVGTYKEKHGYQSSDVIKIEGRSDATREKFLKEHCHSENEVMLFVKGGGIFYLHVEDKVFGVLCLPGHIISIPAGMKHWFDIGENPQLEAIRLVTDSAGWVTKITGDKLSELYPGYDSVLHEYRCNNAFKNYLPMKVDGMYDSLKAVKGYLDSKNLKQGFYTSQADYSIDMYPKSDWYRFYFKTRLGYLTHIRNILEVLDQYKVGYSLNVSSKSFALFVSTGSYKNTTALTRVSDTTDPLYDKCLFEEFNIDGSRILGSYGWELTGFKSSYMSKKQAIDFNCLFELKYPNNGLHWVKEEKYYTCNIIMQDKVDPNEDYVSLSQLLKVKRPLKPKVEKAKESGLVALLKNYSPSEEEKELYESFLSKVKGS